MIRSVTSKVHYIEYERTPRNAPCNVNKLSTYLVSILCRKVLFNNSNQYQQSEHKKDRTYNVENTGPGLGQTQKCGGVKPVNGIPNTTIML